MAEEERELTEEERTEADRKARRSRRIKLAVLGLVLILLSVGVTLALLHFLGEEPASPTDAEAQAEPVEPADQKAIYFPLKEKILINYEVKGRQRFLQTEITLMCRDNAVPAALEQHLPRVRNDLIMLFSGQRFEDLQTPEGRELLRQDALRVVQSIMDEEIGQPGVEQVLFTSFVMQ
ncbi:flagellar basal body-associated FliL family protein [Marinimicrobium sp. ARAG 43.8]|uniref:flagellar basal body-associated FliL family protein n=1 Tax=Marinimicrobium sp. ARAG 43.8 TaxID=3418719 RepID=UPI003CF9BCCD